MPKMTKNDLKDIVKECLIEILAEGLVSRPQKEMVTARKSKRLRESLSKTSTSTGEKFKKPSYLQGIDKQGIDKSEKPNLSREKIKKFKDVASNITTDPIMSEMLADTAQTTLQEQFAAESKQGYVPTGAGDRAQKIVESKNPEDLFGQEAASKWASLAFNS